MTPSVPTRRSSDLEQGITAKNVATMANSPDPEIRRLLGVEGDLGRRLGLDPVWAARAIAQVGNYGEIFERNLGTDRSEEHTSELQSLMRISYAVFCLQKNKTNNQTHTKKQ